MGSSSSRASYHIFSIWVRGTLETERGPGSGALLRISATEGADAAAWLAALLSATGTKAPSALEHSPDQPPHVRSMPSGAADDKTDAGRLTPLNLPAGAPSAAGAPSGCGSA